MKTTSGKSERKSQRKKRKGVEAREKKQNSPHGGSKGGRLKPGGKKITQFGDGRRNGKHQQHTPVGVGGEMRENPTRE